jgi:heme-degrading monooxygenase HmoA
MIARIWHGYTTPENADGYENLLRTEIFHAIENRHIEGFKDIQLLRRELQNETEFITIMRFESIDAVKKFAGKEYEKAVVPEKAQQVLKRFDDVSQHYEIKEQLSYP